MAKDNITIHKYYNLICRFVFPISMVSDSKILYVYTIIKQINKFIVDNDSPVSHKQGKGKVNKLYGTGWTSEVLASIYDSLCVCT